MPVRDNASPCEFLFCSIGSNYTSYCTILLFIFVFVPSRSEFLFQWNWNLHFIMKSICHKNSPILKQLIGLGVFFWWQSDCGTTNVLNPHVKLSWNIHKSDCDVLSLLNLLVFSEWYLIKLGGVFLVSFLCLPFEILCLVFG